jgi:hypothetical protein
MQEGGDVGAQPENPTAAEPQKVSDLIASALVDALLVTLHVLRRRSS